MQFTLRLLQHNVHIVFVFIVFSLLTWMFWNMDFYFAFMDEWYLMDQYVSGEYHYLAFHNEHFKPLFKLFYKGMLDAFGINFMLIHYVQLLIHALTGTALFVLIRKFSRSTFYSVLAALFFLLNPFHWLAMAWNMHISGMMTMFLSIITLIFLFRFKDFEQTIDMYFAYFFAFIASYFFGQGLLMPLIFIAFCLLFFKREHYKYIIFFVCLFVFNAALYQILNTGNSPSVALSDVPSIIRFMFEGMYINIVRILTLLNKPALYISIPFYIVFSLMWAFLSKKDAKHLRIILFCIAMYVVPFMLISLARFEVDNGTTAPRYMYYYIPPISIALGVIFATFSNMLKERYSHNMLYYAGIVLFAVYFYFALPQIAPLMKSRQNIYVYSFVEMYNSIVKEDYTPDYSKMLFEDDPSMIKRIYTELSDVPLKEDPNFERLSSIDGVSVTK